MTRATCRMLRHTAVPLDAAMHFEFPLARHDDADGQQDGNADPNSSERSERTDALLPRKPRAFMAEDDTAPGPGKALTPRAISPKRCWAVSTE